MMDIHQIMKTLPHRYPFLLVDRVLECTPGKSLVAVKNVTINEPYFVGHFPNRPVMPGVLILEALAQATGLLAFASAGGSAEEHGLYYFAGIDEVRFRKPVEPGDQLVLEVELLRLRRGIGKFAARALVEDEVVCEGVLMCAEREFGA